MKRQIRIGTLNIGAGAPIRVESMLKRRLDDVDSCLKQLYSLKEEGCELVRVAFPHISLKKELKCLNENSPLALMADIHFDPALAEGAIEAGVPSIRINPGNMGSPKRLARVVDMARDNGVVIRIGANSGSINSLQIKQAQGDKGAALALAVSEQMEALLTLKFDNIIVSAKSTDINESIRANILLQRMYGDFPFHVGITEAGSGLDGVVKSSCGLSRLFALGIGDTMRVSLTQDPEDEVKTAYSILRSLGLRHRGATLTSCPTCGRRQWEVADMIKQICPLTKNLPDGFSIAVMGCEVNGPQEAKGAELGIAGTPSGVAIFKKGQIIERTSKDEALNTFKKYLPQ